VVAAWPPGGYGPPAQQKSPRKRLGNLRYAATLVLAVAALVVGIIAITRPAAPPQNGPASLMKPTTAASKQETATANRALCVTIAPLMAESDREAHEYIDAGPAGSSQRDAAIPKYRADTEDWSRRTQDALDAHPDAQPFFKRTLQRFIDDLELLVANVRPGPSTKYDDSAYNDSMVAYGGPLAICQALGVQW
jgi:hypothetical protein